MRKICFIIPSVAAGGIETYLLRFLDYLGHDNDVTVIVRGSTDGELKEKYLEKGLRLLFMPLGYINPGRSYRYFRFFKHEAFDVVCDFNANFSGISMLAARLAGIKKRIAFYRQGRDHFSPGMIRNSVNRILNRLVYRNATKILFNSRSAVDVFFPYREKTDPRFKVIYNGIDPRKFSYDGTQREARRNLGLPEGTFIIGHIGRNDPAKNHKTIFKAASELVKQKANVHFVLCGSGTEKFEIEKERYELNEHMTILGYRDDIPKVLRSLDLFFFPSKTEGQPNALIEALIAGLPVMASNIAPIKECIPTYYHKYLTEPEDFKEFGKIAQSLKNNPNTNGLFSWAKDKFDSNKNFEKFKRELICE